MDVGVESFGSRTSWVSGVVPGRVTWGDSVKKHLTGMCRVN